jgi:hypothetical protein
VPYTGATADVNLGTHDLTAERGTFANNGSSDTLTVNHTSGSGYGIIVTKGGANEALYVSKTSGSGNAMTVVGGRTSLVDLALSSVTNTAGDFLTLSGGVVHKRTAVEVRTDIGAGTVTSVAALTLGTSGTDLSSTVANGTTTPVITLNVPTASATNRGALSSSDWSMFNNKQAQLNGTGFVKASGTTISYDNTSYLSLTGGTITGNLTVNGIYNVPASSYFISGVNGFRFNNSADTFNNFIIYDNGNTLTRGEATFSNLAGSGTRMVVANSSGLLSTQAIPLGTVISVTASSPLASSGGTTPNITIQQASGSQSGFLSSTDWTTFNNKQNALNGTGFVKASGTTISYDNSTYLTTSAAASTYLPLIGGTLTNTGGNQNPILSFASSSTDMFQWITGAFNANMGVGNTMVHFIGQAASTKNSGYLGFNYAGNQSDSNYLSLGFFNNDHLVRLYANGNLGVGVTSNAGFKLDVNGTGRFSGALTLTASANRINSGNELRFYRTDNAIYTQLYDGGNANGFVLDNRNGDGFSFQSAGTNQLRIASTGAATFFGTVAGGQNIRIQTTVAAGRNYIQWANPSGDMGYIGYGGADSKFYIYNQLNDAMIFGTNSIERVQIHQNGNIVFKGQSTATSGESLFQNNDSALSFYSTQTSVLASKEIRFFTKVVSGEQRMTILANGNVLIGTTSDNGTKFQVASAVTGSNPAIDCLVTGSGRFRRGFRILNSGMSGDTDLMLSLGQSESSRNMGQFYYYYAGNGSTSNRASIGLFGVDDVLNVMGSGNVLIGTITDTSDKLRVNGTTFSNNIMTWNPANDNRSGVAWRLGAASIGTDILNRRLRVNVGGVEYYIGAVEV